MTSLAQRWLFTLTILLLNRAQGTSFLVATSGKSICKTAELAKDTFIKIIYEAPDLKTSENGRKPGPVYLSITEQPTETAQEAIEKEEGRRARRKPQRAPAPISHEMKEEFGNFVHSVTRDSEVNFCIRASAAGSKNPMRFSLRLEEMGDEEELTINVPPAQSVDQHLSSMEEQLNRIESQMHAVLREADFAKDRDSVYHTKTDAMHKSITFWPIIHICILLATGFTQANHIVQFFKKRRII